MRQPRASTNISGLQMNGLGKHPFVDNMDEGDTKLPCIAELKPPNPRDEVSTEPKMRSLQAQR